VWVILGNVVGFGSLYLLIPVQYVIIVHMIQDPEIDTAMTRPHPLDRIGDLLTTTQAAARCGITERSLSAYWRAGAGPVRTRVGGKVFVAEQALADWLTARTDPQPPAMLSGLPG
jgi:hypothetical protein